MERHDSAPSLLLPRPGEDQRFGSLRRRVYLISLPLGVVGVVLAWALQVHLNAFDRIAFPALTGWLALVWGLMLLSAARNAGQRFARVVEALALGGMAAFFIGRFYYVFYVNYPLMDAAQELVLFSHWFPVVYILMFLINRARRGLFASLLFFGVIFALGVGHVILQVMAGKALGEFSALAQIYLSNAALIALVYAFAVLDEQYVRVRVLAETMQHLAQTDFLTGIPNRRQITERLEQELVRAERHERPFSIIMFDLDHFKRVNDQFGHAVGDVVLSTIAKLVQQDLRLIDQLGRWGGEEFMIVAAETSVEQAERLAERLRKVMANHSLDRVGTMTASFGVTGYQHADSIESLVRRADAALYTAKARGRNRVEALHATPERI